MKLFPLFIFSSLALIFQPVLYAYPSNAQFSYSPRRQISKHFSKYRRHLSNNPKPPQFLDINTLPDVSLARKEQPSQTQLLTDLPTVYDVVRSEQQQLQRPALTAFQQPMSLMPTFLPTELATFSNPNPVFRIGSPSFLTQYPAMNLINPSVSMSLLSPYMTYMNQNWVDPVQTNPFMINPYFAPGFSKKREPKNPNSVTSSQSFTPTGYFMPPMQTPLQNQNEDGRRSKL